MLVAHGLGYAVAAKLWYAACSCVPKGSYDKHVDTLHCRLYNHMSQVKLLLFHGLPKMHCDMLIAQSGMHLFSCRQTQWLLQTTWNQLYSMPNKPQQHQQAYRPSTELPCWHVAGPTCSRHMQPC